MSATSTSVSTLIYQVVVPLLLVLAGLGAYFGLGVNRDSPSRPADDSAPLVETVAVQNAAAGFDLKTDGRVVPYREIQLTAEVAGRIVTKSELCRAGRYVDEGMLLLKIDPRDFDLEITRLQKELNQADAALQELDVEASNTQALIDLAQRDLDIQQKELRRLEGLKGVVTDAEVDKVRRADIAAKSTMQQWRNQLLLQQTKRSRLEQARGHVEALLAKARLDRERTEIRTPVSGVVISDPVEQNGYVQKGTLLATIEDTSAVEIECHLRMEELAWLWRTAPLPPPATRETPDANSDTADAGSRRADEQVAAGYEAPLVQAKVTYELAGRTYQWDGRLSRFDGLGLDEKTRTVPCRVVVPRPREVTLVDATDPAATLRAGGPRALVRGMYVEVRFNIKPTEPLLRVPERTVRHVAASELRPISAAKEGDDKNPLSPPLKAGTVVWLVRDGKLLLTPVRVVRAVGADLLVQADPSQLRAGDKIVVSPLAYVRNGMPVREASQP